MTKLSITTLGIGTLLVSSNCTVPDKEIIRPNIILLVGGRQVDYPHVIEHDRYIYVAHASAKQTVEVHRIRISDLDNLQMSK
jgi:hypothetical protein